MKTHGPRPIMLFALAFFALAICATHAGAQTRPPKAERFSAILVANSEKLARYASPIAQAAILKLVNERKCPQDEVKLFMNQKTTRGTMILTVHCDPPLGSNEVGGRYFEYPLTIFIHGDKVSEVDLRNHGFMYDTGKIRYISDIDGNDWPEFWLSGDVCEPDPDTKMGSCHGAVIVEFRNGILRPWKKTTNPSVR